MALTGMHNMEAAFTCRGQNILDRLDRRPCKREIVAHLVDISSLPTKVSLHIDDEKERVLRTQITVVRPAIRIRRHVAFLHVRTIHGHSATWPSPPGCSWPSPPGCSISAALGATSANLAQ